MGIYANRNELTKIAQAQELTKHMIFDLVHPIGSIYMSINSTDPSTLFGGTWERLKDRFLLGAGDSYGNGSTGGASTHTLTTAELPSHTHTQSSCNSTGGHTHTFSANGSVFKGHEATSSDTSYNIGKTVRGTTNVTTSSNGGHTHTCPLNNTGDGGAHNNMPPYLVVMMWKRTG